MVTFFEMLHRTAEILTNGRQTETLFDYMMHAMDDDGGFLRTRWVYWENTTLKDGKYNEAPRIFLVALAFPFDFENDTDYYKFETQTGMAENENGELEKVTVTNQLTKLEMQIFYTDMSREDRFLSNAQLSGQVGYPYPVRIDLERGTAEILDRVETDY